MFTIRNLLTGLIGLTLLSGAGSAFAVVTDHANVGDRQAANVRPIPHFMNLDESKLIRDLQGTGATVSHETDFLKILVPTQANFKSGSSTINDHGQTILMAVSKTMKQYPMSVAEISGHTDSVASAASNQQLSIQRAQAFSQFLAQQGIDKSRLVIVGHGESKPIANNNTAQGRTMNRRVEIDLYAAKGRKA